MENKTKKERGYLNLFIRRLLSLRNDKAPEEETIASIKASVEFRGANLWILIFAIFVASLAEHQLGRRHHRCHVDFTSHGTYHGHGTRRRYQ